MTTKSNMLKTMTSTHNLTFVQLFCYSSEKCTSQFTAAKEITENLCVQSTYCLKADIYIKFYKQVFIVQKEFEIKTLDSCFSKIQ